MSGYLDEVREAVSRIVPAALQEWLPEGHVVGHYYACANLNGGRGDSLKVDLRRGYWKDYASNEKGGDLIDLYAKTHGMDYKAALHELAGKLGVSKPKRGPSREFQTVVPVPDSSLIIGDDGLPALPDIPFKINPTAFWRYFNADWQLMFFVIRFDPPAPQRKFFHPLSYCLDSKSGQYSWQLRPVPKPRPLYNLPMVAGSEKVLIVEGEKSADSAQRLLPEWTVVTWPGGANAEEYADWSPVCSLPKETRIVLWPDADKKGTGQATMARVAKLLARDVEILEPDPAWPDKYDVADLEKDGWTEERAKEFIAGSGASIAWREPEERPEVALFGGDFRKQADEIFKAIETAGANLFYSGSGVCRVVQDSLRGARIQTLEPRQLCAWLQTSLRPVRFDRDSGGTKDCQVSEKLANVIILTASSRLRAIREVSDIPIFRADGSCADRDGYDLDSKAWVSLPAGYKSDMDIEEAWELIGDLLADFPFETESDRTHAIAMPITSLVRSVIFGPTPLFRFEAPVGRTGKSLLCECLCRIITPNADSTPFPNNDDSEMRKLITTRLMEGARIIYFDNVEKFASGILKMALTQHAWNDRMMGGNSSFYAPIRNLWALTANNPTLGREFAGRSLRIRLNAHSDRPETRKGFRHKNLKQYVYDNRGAMLSAFAAVTKRGLEVGTAEEVPAALGGFESFVWTLHRILSGAEYEGFLGTSDDDADLSGEGSNEGLAEFIQRWAESYGDAEVATSTLASLASSLSEPPLKPNGNGRVSAKSLGWLLRCKRGVIVDGFEICRGKRKETSRSWRLYGDFSKVTASMEGQF